MFCIKCGAQLPDDAMFCSVCGNATKVPTVSNASEMVSADEHNHEQNSVEESKENQKENSKESSNENSKESSNGNDNGNQTLVEENANASEMINSSAAKPTVSMTENKLNKSSNGKKAKKEDISSLTGIEKYIYYNRKIGCVMYFIFAVIFLLIAIFAKSLYPVFAAVVYVLVGIGLKHEKASDIKELSTYQKIRWSVGATISHIISIIVMLVIIIFIVFGAALGIASLAAADEDDVIIENLSFGEWQEQEYPNKLRTCIAVKPEQAKNRKTDNIMVLTGPLSNICVIIADKDGKNVCDWKWLTDSSVDSDGIAEFRAVLEYEGEMEGYPVFYYSEVEEFDAAIFDDSNSSEENNSVNSEGSIDLSKAANYVGTWQDPMYEREYVIISPLPYDGYYDIEISSSYSAWETWYGSYIGVYNSSEDRMDYEGVEFITTHNDDYTDCEYSNLKSGGGYFYFDGSIMKNAENSVSMEICGEPYEADDYIQVAAPDGYVNMRAGKGTNYDVQLQLPNGTVLPLADSFNANEKWQHVFFDGYDGYVATSQITNELATSLVSNTSNNGNSYTNNGNSEYIYEDAVNCVMGEGDLQIARENYHGELPGGRSLEQMIVNEIYARHGYIFKADELNKFFGSKSWYSPKTSDMSEIEYELSNMEKDTIKFLKSK